VWEIMEENGTVPEEQQGVVTGWMDHVRASVQPLTQISRKEIVQRRRPWELYIVEYILYLFISFVTGATYVDHGDVGIYIVLT
jgi:hypothetical protein